MPHFIKHPVLVEAIQWDGSPHPAILVSYNQATMKDAHYVNTNHGPAVITKGDWLLRSPEGEYYPCLDEVFRKTYYPADHKLDGGDIGWAVAMAHAGHRVAREGWNGKGMWLSYTPGTRVPAENFWSGNNAEFAKANGGFAEVLPYLTMKTADGKIVPWLASHTDILAHDWVLAS